MGVTDGFSFLLHRPAAWGVAESYGIPFHRDATNNVTWDRPKMWQWYYGLVFSVLFLFSFFTAPSSNVFLNTNSEKRDPVELE